MFNFFLASEAQYFNKKKNKKTKMQIIELLNFKFYKENLLIGLK